MSGNHSPELFIDSISAISALTFTTFQFSNEFWNTVINATLVTLILVNLGSIAYKLMNRTEKNCFEYEHWIRSLVYSNSDDPIRLISWACGRYSYRKQGWSGNNRVPCRRRLAVPLCTRAVLLILIAVSIVISAPGEISLEGCETGDHKLVLDVDRARRLAEEQTGAEMPDLCVPVHIKCNIGSVSSSTTYCAEFGRFDNKSIPESVPKIEEIIEDIREPSAELSSVRQLFLPESEPTTDADMIIVVERTETGVISTYAQNSQESTFCFGFKSSVGWRLHHNDPYHELKSYLPREWELEAFGKLIEFSVSKAGNTQCALRDTIHNGTLNDGITPKSSYYLLKCEIDLKVQTLSIIKGIEKYFRGGLRWERTPELQFRVAVNPQGQGSSGGTRQERDRCPVRVSLQTPWVNMLPLLAILFSVMIANMLITTYIEKVHGNILDANYHIMNEVLNRDTTCNPLERSRTSGEVEHLRLKLWRCSTGSKHIGFLRRKGDEEAQGESSVDSIEDENYDQFGNAEGQVVSKCECDGKYIFEGKNMSRNDEFV